MADKKKWVVNGFQFGTENDAETAKNEKLRIEKLEEKMNTAFGKLFTIKSVHGKMEPEEKEQVMKDFEKGKITVANFKRKMIPFRLPRPAGLERSVS